jgi:glycosyltransferase involved in cell wall biosynthesis
VRILFAKHSLLWPRSTGHDINLFYMMKTCAALGHEISLATVLEPAPDAVAGLQLTAQMSLGAETGNGAVASSTRLQTRFRSYYGVTEAQMSALAGAAKATRAEAVVLAGIDALSYLPALSGMVRVWYANDEWVWHYLSQLRYKDGAPHGRVKAAAVMGLYERAHASLVDRVWVVSESDRKAMRWFGGMRTVDVLPSGVDSEYFTPGGEVEEDRTAVFWGRLDFGPNIQALQWFCRRVWPQVRLAVPDARFTIVGFDPPDDVRGLAGTDGISLLPDVPDLRPTVRRHSLVALPFVSGGGIKNKLLEGAALGKAIICTPRALGGLRAAADAPLAVAGDPGAFARQMIDLWAQPERRRQMGSRAREWVCEHHTWAATARDAVAGIEASASAVAVRAQDR